MDGLLEAMGDAAFVCDVSGTIVRRNATAEATFGDRSAPGNSVHDLVLEPASLDLQPPPSSRAEQTSNTRRIAATTSRQRDALIRVRWSGPWRIVEVNEPRSDRWMGSTPLPNETLRTLIETMRDPLASVRAAAETIMLYPSMDTDAAAQFMQIIDEQTEILSERLDMAVASYAQFYRDAGPLEPMVASELERVVRAHLERRVEVDIAAEEGTGCSSGDVLTGGSGNPMRVQVDLSALTEATAFLARRLENATRCTELAVSVTPVRGLAALDLTWEGPRLRPERLREWEADTLTLRSSLVKMTLAELVDHHDAQLLVQSEPNRVRLLLPTG
jgi:signal transduction histidine kinase